MVTKSGLVALLVAAYVACTNSKTVRYRLPLEGNAGGQSCYDQCRPLHDSAGPDAFTGCWKKCPGIQQANDAVCFPDRVSDRPPVAACVAETVKRANVVAVVAGTVAVFAVLYVGSLLLFPSPG